MTSTRLHLTSYLILLPLLFPALTTAQAVNDSALPTETATTIDTLAEVANTDVASASNLAGEAPVSATVESECRQIGDKLASISYDNCMASGLNLTGSASVKNIPILYRDFAPLARVTIDRLVLFRFMIITQAFPFDSNRILPQILHENRV